MNHPRVWSALVCAALWSCGHPVATPPPHVVPPPPADAAPPPVDAVARIGVALTVTPADAEVLIDGESHGKASALDPVVELKPGLYTLLVTKDGYRPYRVEFSVGEKTETFVVRLEPIKK